MRTEQPLQAAVANAIGFFAGSREPFALLWLELMHRRFGIRQFADALQRFDQLLAKQPEQSPLLRVFRRIADHDNILRPEDIDAVTHPSDQMVVWALYCDQLELPSSFFSGVLEKSVQAGGYYLTHALLAVIWIRQFGRDFTLPDAFIDSLYRANAALINENPRTVTDLKLEAAAFLYLAGQEVLVDRTFVETVLLTQQRDGGWGRSRDGARSDWHATVLGLLLLLHVRSQ